MSGLFNLNWSEDDINFLVKLYKYHECLWNQNKDSYKDHNLRKLAFDDIEAKMKMEKNISGFGVRETIDAISKIQTRYFALRKIGSVSDPSPPMCWYKDFDFIQRTNYENLVDDENHTLEDEITDINDEEVSFSAHGLGPLSASSSSSQNPEYGCKDKSTITFNSRVEIMNVLMKLYKEKVPSNFKMVHHILTNILKSTDHCLTSSVDTLAYHMISLGYIYKETANGIKILIENPKQRFERYLYLMKMSRIREKNKIQNIPIVYIDERVVDMHQKYQKLTDDGLPANSCLFYHAITKKGLLHGLFCNKASEKDFLKWITDIVLALLKTPSLIIMDNGPLHGRLINSCSITRYSTKQEILNYLNSKNIPCSPQLSRPELYELVKKIKSYKKEYKIDRILRSHGHDVLRLPSNFPDFSLTDPLWRDISGEVKSKSNMTKPAPSQLSTENLQSKILNTIFPSIDCSKWINYEFAVTVMEKKIFQVDAEIEYLLESYSFKTNDNSQRVY